jgi:hypothetical protein
MTFTITSPRPHTNVKNNFGMFMDIHSDIDM